MSADADETHQVREIARRRYRCYIVLVSPPCLPNVAEWCGLQRLKAAVHYTVGRICHRIGEERRAEYSRQTIAAIAETVVRQCGEWQRRSLSLAIQQVVGLFIF